MRPELVFAGIGALSIVVGLPLADRRIAPNRWYGVRLRATFADERVWYEVNAQAGRDLVLLGVAVLVLSLALVDKVPTERFVLWCGPVFGVGSLVILVRSVRLANRLWRERGRGDSDANSRRPR